MISRSPGTRVWHRSFWKSIRAALLCAAAIVSPFSSQSQTSLPSITGAPRPTTLAGELYYFVPHTSNPGSENLTYWIFNKPDWLSFDESYGWLWGTPTVADVGRYDPIVIGVYDENGDGNVIGPFNIEVFSPDEPWARLSWQAPTTNIDGSSLTDLAGYRLHHFSPGSLEISVTELMDPDLRIHVFGDLAEGVHVFYLTALNTRGMESPLSEIVYKAIP